LRDNKNIWLPRSVIAFDTETSPDRRADREVLRLRCWTARHYRYSPDAGGLVLNATGAGCARADLAQWFDETCARGLSTWAYAHNLGFDLTVTALTEHLFHRGWELSDWTFAGKNVTGRMRKGKTKLALCDSFSLVPAPLAAIGTMVGLEKGILPADNASENEWLEYCARDTEVLGTALVELMAWWEEHELGHWTQSGPGLGYNAFRHKMRPARPPRDPDRPGEVHLGWGENRKPPIVIRTEPDGIGHDRLAVYGGRRDVTHVGEMTGGPFALLDFGNAYLTVAANHPLPAGRMAHYRDLEQRYRRSPRSWGSIVAECELDTPVARYPLRTATGVFYPVGRFTTTLAGPEIGWADQAGHLVRVGPGYLHRTSSALRPWARWCLEVIDPAERATAPVVKAMVKQWGRSVIGRFAGRQAGVRDVGPQIYPHWHYQPAVVGWGGTPGAMVNMAGRQWLYRFDQDGDDAYPAVLAFVESYVRVALGKVLEALGETVWLTCDTDGVVIDLSAARSWLQERSGRPTRYRNPLRVAEAVCGALAPLCGPLALRTKLVAENLTVAGPQHYQLGPLERAAGRPSRPELEPDGTPRWWTWPGARWQMSHGDPAGFVRVEQQWTAPANTAHRWVLADGRALPVFATLTPTGQSAIARWGAGPGPEYHGELEPTQAPALAGLYPSSSNAETL
jgi:hypothetical protein